VPRDRSKAGADGSRLLAKTSSGLAPGLKRNDNVVIDSLPARKVPGVREAIEATRRHTPLCAPILTGLNTPSRCHWAN